MSQKTNACRVIIHSNKTVVLSPSLFGAYAWLNLIRVARKDSHLARVHPRLFAWSEGEEMRFRIRDDLLPAVERWALASQLGWLMKRGCGGRPAISATLVHYYRFVLRATDDPIEMTRLHAAGL